MAASTTKKDMRPLIALDGHECRVRGCGSPTSRFSWHHIVFKSHGGSDLPFNRFPSCGYHHTQFHRGIDHFRLGHLTAHQAMIYVLNDHLGKPWYRWWRSHGELLVKQIAQWYAQEVRSSNG